MRNFLLEEHRIAFLEALEKKIGRKLLFIDMDGVIADFDKTADLWSEKMGITGQEFKDQKKYRQPNFYLELEPMNGAIDSIKELDEKFEVRFLSAPSWGNPSSFTEKRLWVENYFGAWGKKRMDLIFRKDLSMGHFLVDDRKKYGADVFIGEHIMYGSDEFKDWSIVKPYLIERA